MNTYQTVGSSELLKKKSHTFSSFSIFLVQSSYFEQMQQGEQQFNFMKQKYMDVFSLIYNSTLPPLAWHMSCIQEFKYTWWTLHAPKPQ
jgi:hypothetical protein